MLATILSRIHFRVVGLMMLVCLAAGLASCATKESPPLIADPASTRETALPWNEQQKWEREGEASALNQQRR
jgi:hypothetical protein